MAWALLYPGPASSSSILSPQLLPEAAWFSRSIFVPVCQRRAWARGAWKDLLGTLASPGRPDAQVFSTSSPVIGNT